MCGGKAADRGLIRYARKDRDQRPRSAPPARRFPHWPKPPWPTSATTGPSAGCPRWPATQVLIPGADGPTARLGPARPCAARGRRVGRAGVARTGRTGFGVDQAVRRRGRRRPARRRHPAHQLRERRPGHRARGADEGRRHLRVRPAPARPDLPARRVPGVLTQLRGHLLVLLVAGARLQPLGLRHAGCRQPRPGARRHRGLGVAGGRPAGAAGHRVRHPLPAGDAKTTSAPTRTAEPEPSTRPDPVREAGHAGPGEHVDEAERRHDVGHRPAGEHVAHRRARRAIPQPSTDPTTEPATTAPAAVVDERGRPTGGSDGGGPPWPGSPSAPSSSPASAAPPSSGPDRGSS